jgi:ribosomal protein S18 acetylase RimI-like enzyme
MINYRFGNMDDNEQLIKLTSSTGMSGETSLRIDRNPNFFKLLELRGESKVFVALEGETIIGSLCVSLQHIYLAGKKTTLQYIGDFKVSEAYRNQGIGLELCNNLANFALEAGTDLCFLNVSKGNSKPFSFFKGRPGIADFDPIGTFNIYQFIGRKNKSSDAYYSVEQVTPDDELIDFFNFHYSKCELGPVITYEKLIGTDTFVIRDNHRIVAAMCLLDTMPFKQNVVLKISKSKKILLTVINSISPIFGISKMPIINEPVKMFYIRYLSVNGLNKQLAQLLIKHAQNIAFEKSYSFVSIGLHEKDPLNACISGFFKLIFNSVGMLVSLSNNRLNIEKVKNGVPFEDYALV